MRPSPSPRSAILSTLAPGFFATPGVPALAAIAFVDPVHRCRLHRRACLRQGPDHDQRPQNHAAGRGDGDRADGDSAGAISRRNSRRRRSRPNGIAAAAALTLLGNARLRMRHGPGGSCQGPGANHPPRDADRHTRGRPHLSCRLERRVPAAAGRCRGEVAGAVCRSGRQLLGPDGRDLGGVLRRHILPWRAQWLGAAAGRGAAGAGPARRLSRNGSAR